MKYGGSRAIYLFISPAWHFHGPICFNPRECCRRNRFLFTLIKIIFCRARSNGQNVTSMTLSFFRAAAVTQQAALLFASFRAAKDTSAWSCTVPVLPAHMCWSELRFMGQVTMPVYFLPNNILNYEFSEFQKAPETAL